MITAVHTLLCSDDPATRTFLRDLLGWPYAEHANPAGEIMLYEPRHPRAYSL